MSSRRIYATSAALLLLVLPFAGCGGDDEDSGESDDDGQTLTFYSNDFQLDVSPGVKSIGDGNASAAGDTYTFSRDLFDSDSFENEVGDIAGLGSVTENDGTTIHQYSTERINLDDGMITAAGDFDVDAKSGEPSESSISLAVTGGTGAYEGASGAIVTEPDGPDNDVITITLED